MSLFKPAQNCMAFAKVGLLGFAGSGKTRTATEIAMGLHKALNSKKPICFLDTETGSDFVLPIFKNHNIELLVSKTRAFKDLAEGLKESPSISDILIIDSLSHFWVDIVESYRKKKGVTRLSFQDWGILKPMWGNDFSTPFVTSALHIIVCGRAGFEYDYFEGEDGKMELYKTGTKMNAEKDFGFEPSLVIEMERVKNPEATQEYKSAKTKDQKTKAAKRMMAEREFVRMATILKDRSDIMDGKVFYNPTYEDFAPHWQAINIGGEHKPLESGDSTGLFDDKGQNDWARRKKMVEIALEEIQGELVNKWPGSAAQEKKLKMDVLHFVFNTRSWTAIEGFGLEFLQGGLKTIRQLISISNGDTNFDDIKNRFLALPKEDVPMFDAQPEPTAGERDD